MKPATMKQACNSGARIVLRGHNRAYAPGDIAFEIERGHAGLLPSGGAIGTVRTWPVVFDSSGGLARPWRPIGARYPTPIDGGELVTILE
jgi:hypothetical protein